MYEGCAPAKINLYLHTTGEITPKGYHLLESLVVFTQYGDFIEIEKVKVGGNPSHENQVYLDIRGPFATGLANSSSNLIVRAVRAMCRYFDKQELFKVVLYKNLPIGAGLGGGSSDAATVIRLLLKSWGLLIKDLCFEDLARDLGADVPACVCAQPLMMSGIGEQITLLKSLPKFAVVLVNPGVFVSTGDVFSQNNLLVHRPLIHRPMSASYSSYTTLGELVRYLKTQENSLTQSAIKSAPCIEEVLNYLSLENACLLARLCGSGATCFGIFKTIEQAKQAEFHIKRQRPHWWVKATQVN